MQKKLSLLFLVTAFCFVPSYTVGTRSGKSFGRKTRSGKVYDETLAVEAKPVVFTGAPTPVDPADAVLPPAIIVAPVVVLPLNNEEPALAINPILIGDLVDDLGTQENPVVITDTEITPAPKAVELGFKVRFLTGLKTLFGGILSKKN